MLEKLENILEKITEYVLLISFFVMVILVFVQVILRYVFNVPQTGFMEISRYLMITLTFIGTGLAVKRDEHIKLDFLASVLENKKSALRIVDTLNNILGIIFGVVIVVLGFGFVKYSISVNEKSVEAGIPMAPIQGTIMVGFALLTFYYIVKLINNLKGEKGGL